MSEAEARERAEKIGLLPCPFCGPGNSMVDPYHDDVSKRWRVGCGRCGASTGIHPRDKGPDVAIAAWNTRNGTARADALREAGNEVLLIRDKYSRSSVQAALEKASAAILALIDNPEPRETGKGWQPIETAPKDGTQVLIAPSAMPSSRKSPS